MTATHTQNGHAPKRVKANRHEVRQSLQEQLAAALLGGKLRRARVLQESLQWYDDWWGGSDILDRIYPRSQDDASGNWLPPSLPSDRRHGSDWPIWRNQFELDQLRQRSRVRAATNAYAAALVNNLTNNVIGKGCTYKAAAIGSDGKPLSEERLTAEAKTIVADVQRYVDEFLRDNHWNGSISPADQTALAGTREREIYRTVKIDGEAFIRFYRYDDGKVKVRPIDCDQVRGEDYTIGLSYGIQHRMEPFEDVETPESYRTYWPDAANKGGEGGGKLDEGTWEDIPADQVLHLKGMNTPSNVKRGLGLFLFDLGAALDRAARLQRNASIGAAGRAAIVETWKHQTATQAQMTSFAQAMGDTTEPDRNGNPRNVEPRFPGMVRRVDAGWEPFPEAADNTSSYLTGKDGDLQQAAAGAGVAAFVLTDLNTGNYSNFESAAYPPVQNATCEQEYFKQGFARCIWKAIEWAVECGRLPKSVLNQITVQVEAPAVLHRNDLQKAQEDNTLIQLGVKSRQQACAERGGDWKQTEAENDQYTKTHPQQGQAGQEQPPVGGGLGGMLGMESREPLYSRLVQLREQYGDALAGDIAGAATRLLESAIENKGQPGHFHDSETGRPVANPNKQEPGSKEPGKHQDVEKAAREYKEMGTKAPAFKQWFGDWEKGEGSRVIKEDGSPQDAHHFPGQGSVVRDKEGKPVVVFHGTPTPGWDHFDANRIKDPNALVYGPGFYFATDQRMAQDYARGTGEVKQVYLNIRKPFDMDRKLSRQEFEEMTGRKIGLLTRAARWLNQEGELTGQDVFEALSNTGRWKAKGEVNKAAAIERLKALGFDGLTHTRGANATARGGMEEDRVWIAFHPAQIKSIENRGTFNPESHNINEGLDGALPLEE